MKKFVSMMLSALLVLSLAACGDKNNASGDKPAAPTSALNILETVWNTYGEDEKFAVAGGDFSEANAREDAPGVFDLRIVRWWTASWVCRRPLRWMRPRPLST